MAQRPSNEPLPSASTQEAPSGYHNAAGLGPFRDVSSIDSTVSSKIHEIWQAWADASENKQPTLAFELFKEELFFGWTSDLSPAEKPVMELQFRDVVMAGEFTEPCNNCPRCQSAEETRGSPGAVIIFRILLPTSLLNFIVEFTYLRGESDKLHVIDEPRSRCNIKWYPRWKDVVKRKIDPEVRRTVNNFNERLAIWMARGFLHNLTLGQDRGFGSSWGDGFVDAGMKVEETLRLWEEFENTI